MLSNPNRTTGANQSNNTKTNSKAREWRHYSGKQTGMVEDLNWSFLQERKPVFLKHAFETKSSPTSPLFLSEHAYVVWLLRVPVICILF